MTSPSTPPKPQASRIAFVSGHTDLDQASFDTHYIPQLDAALTAGDSFFLGDATGVDTQALEYLLSPAITLKYNDIHSRITIYASKPTHIKELSGHGVEVIAPAPRNAHSGLEDCLALLASKIPGEASEAMLESLIGMKNGGKDKFRFQYGLRDARRTLESDYDVLYVRGEAESREMYGNKFRERISATEWNRRRRMILEAMMGGKERPVFEDEMSSWEKGEYDGSEETENREMLGDMVGV
jgi:hypothetical protein